MEETGKEIEYKGTTFLTARFEKKGTGAADPSPTQAVALFLDRLMECIFES